MMNAEQVIAAHKAQLSSLHEMGSKALASAEKIAQLNFQTSKSMLDHHQQHAYSLLGGTDVQSLSKLQHNALHELAGKAAAYNHELFGIAAGLGNEFSELVDSRMAEAQQQFVSTLEASMKNVPQGAGPLVDAVKNALATANQAMDSVQGAVKQATETTQAKLAALSDTTVKATKASKAKVEKADEQTA